MKANPADDTARLVYADWLDEHGEPAKTEYLRRNRKGLRVLWRLSGLGGVPKFIPMLPASLPGIESS